MTLEGSIIPNIIDEIPILAVAAAFAVGTFEVRGAFELRNKESDRIGAVCENLSLMGLEVEEREDGFAFDSKNTLIPSSFDSFGDHRIAMAFGVAAASLQGESTLKDSELRRYFIPGILGYASHVGKLIEVIVASVKLENIRKEYEGGVTLP